MKIKNLYIHDNKERKIRKIRKDTRNKIQKIRRKKKTGYKNKINIDLT